MGMSSHVYGFKPPDETWKKMKQVYDACKKAGIKDLPQEVDKYFEGESPDPSGVKVEIREATENYSAGMEEGFEIHIDKLPQDVKIIRFVNSY